MTAAIFLAILCLGLASAAPTPDYSLDAEWEEWKRSFEKTYSPVGHMDTQSSVFVEHVHCCWGFMDITETIDAIPT